jgi:ribosomal protein S18 acetylase RimI-like enzyme
MEIRRYQPADAGAVWELHNLALQGTGAHLGNGPWDEDLKHIPDVYERNGGVFLVGVLDERIVAMGAVRRVDATTGRLTRVRVLPDYQRRGLGGRILCALETEARRLGYRALRLDTAAVQRAAQKLYERHGYRKVRETTVGGLDALIYEKELSGSPGPSG